MNCREYKAFVLSDKQTDWRRVAIALKKRFAGAWLDRSDYYWFARLVQEVGELGGSIAGDCEDPLEWELAQIASLALNWLDKLIREKQEK